MTYEYFLTHLERKILESLEDGEAVKKVQILKNNGVKLDGFSYCVEGHREQPTVYVNQHYRRELAEVELADIACLVLETLRACRLFSGQSVEQMMDFGQIRERIFCRLISREKNEQLLEEVPWLPWMDLAVVFHFLVPEHVIARATALIYTRHMEYWGVTLEEICQSAAENMAKSEVFLEPMESILEGPGLESLQSGMYILSNNRKEYGAALIVAPQVQRLCFRKLGGNYYVIPSSVHELLLLPENLSAGRQELDLLIQEVNETCVSREEYLSGHAYFYSGETGTICF